MELILAIATILGGITAVWFFLEQLSSKTDILNEIDINIESIDSPNWASDTAFLSFSIYNSSSKPMFVSEVNIVVEGVIQQFELKEVLPGAPVVPINGTAQIKAKEGKYPIKFEEDISKFKYQVDDIDSFLVTLTFQEGYIYKFKISAKGKPLNKNSSKIFFSEMIEYTSQISSAELALKKLQEQQSGNL